MWIIFYAPFVIIVLVLYNWENRLLLNTWLESFSNAALYIDSIKPESAAIYSQLSSPQIRLSRITAYLEV